MRRRRFLRLGTAVGTIGLAGCFGGGNSQPPPRQAEVYDGIGTNDGDIVVNLASDMRVESRENVDVSAALAIGLPVGRAAAQKGGSDRGAGATGRGAGGWIAAPKNGHGRAVYRGHDDDDEWREDHQEEISRYPVSVAAVGLGYMGTESSFSDDPPPAGPLDDWDQRWDGPSSGETLSMAVPEQGWYRVGSQLVSPDGQHTFGWESVDFKIDDEGDGYEVENRWQVSPRL